MVSFCDNTAGLGEVELEEPSQWISSLFAELGFLILGSLEEKKSLKKE